MTPAWLHGAGASALREHVRGALAATLDLLLPRACVACERPMDASDRGIVCGRCWARMLALPMPQCDRCGHPHVKHRCRWCDLVPPYVRAVRSVCWVPGGAAGNIVHALKYGGWSLVAEAMAERIARLAWPADVREERRAIVPVPLAAGKLRDRGYNQSELLARGLASRWRVPVWRDALVRTRETETQTRLTPSERLRNVAGAFRAAPGAAERLRGAHLVLVDDVVTTGATLNACAAALLEGGARIVSYATFGRARQASDA
jgi:ComF family protein